MAATEKNKQTKVKWTGLGLWNVFFIGEFLLGGFGYLSLKFLQRHVLRLNHQQAEDVAV